jgi:hypothetical protein
MKKKYLENNTHTNNGSSKLITTKKPIGFNSNWFLTLIVVLFSSQFSDKIYAQTVTEIITTTGAGTWTVPAGITSIKVEVWGSGGSGGGSALGKDKAGSGGTGGTYATSTFAASGTYNYFVAPITTAVSSSNGNDGVSSWFNTSLFLNANGGLKGLVGDGPAVTAITTGSAGTTIIAGGSTLTGTTTFGSAGGAGGNGGGAGGLVTAAPSNGNFLNGNIGSSPGGGGSGGSTGGGSCGCTSTGGIGARGEIRITYLKITSLGSTSGCVGSSITINGTDFTGATAANVTIGGTPVTSITSNTGTQIVAVVGAGTTGTVSITIAGKGTTTSAATFTVNPSPSISTQPVATSVCTPGSTSLSVVASGVTTYQWRRNGVNLTNVPPYSNVTTASLTITNPAVGDAGNFDVVLNSATCPLTSNSVALIVNTIPSASITPSPTNAATDVCFSGVGAITSVSWAATATATSYDVYFGAGSLPGSVTSNVATNSYTAGTLLASTTYYWKVVAKNACGDAVGSATWTFTTAAAICTVSYCTPTGNLNCTTSGDYIANVTFNTLNNSTTCNTGGYTVFAATGSQTTTVIRGNTFNFSLGTGTGNKKHGAAVWIDFNQNGFFTDAGEYFFIGNGIIANSVNTIAIAIPVGATLGSTRMRVRYGQKETMASTMSCTMTGAYGETEDYTITIADPIVCVAPTTQPTALILNPTGTTIAGSFTAPSPAPNNYLVYISTTNTAPTPVNGTTYVIGAAFGLGTIVDVDSNVTFTATGLTPLTTYYVFVFAYNSACTGGPTYNISSPLTGTATTIASNYCIPSVTSPKEDDNYITEVSFIGTLNDVSNYSTFSSSPRGYQDFTGLTNLSRQAQGEGVNISVQAVYTSYIKAWVDWNKDGLFDVTTEIVYNSAGISTGSTTFGFIIPSAQALGNYRLRVRINLNNLPNPDSDSTTFTSCLNLDNGGETEDYLFTVVASCNSLIDTVTDARTCGTGTVDLVAGSSSVGVTEYRWYLTPTGATLVGTSPTGSWTTPSINNTTTYYVTAYNGCESLVRTAINAIVSPVPSLTYSPTNPTVCGEDVVIALNATGDFEEVFLIDEKFTSGLGTFINTNIASTARNTDTQWQNRTSTFIPTVITNVNTWYPAISTGVNGNGFAIATSDFSNATPFVHNQIASATLNSTNFVSLNLILRMYYSRYYIDDTNLTLDYVTIDVSTNGGAAWTEIKRFTEDVGIGTRFETLTYDLSAYINQSNLKVRVRYYGTWCDGVAVDDIKLYGNRPIGTALSWTSATPVAAFTNAACTIPYVANTPAVDVYIKPTLAQLEEGTYTFTANAILDNGCTTSQVITVTNNSKIWQGGTNWETAANWKPTGVPTADSCVIIPSTSVIPGSSYQAFAKNLTVKPTGNLDITSGSSLTVTDFVNVNTNGIFTIKNSASLIQINDLAINTGNISMDRSTSIRQLDYVYWSSPVENFSAAAVSAGTPSGYIYKWNPTIANSNGGFGNWVSGNETMSIGKGYIIRGPSSYTTTPAAFTTTFTGVPYNGIKQPSVSRGNVTTSSTGTNGIPITNLDDNWNLIGNPYPSAINAIPFLALNTNLDGNIRIWTHGSPISASNPNPFYSSFGANYTVNDYVSYNGTGSTPPGYNGKIGAGQGFFVVMNDGTASTQNVTFNNSFRSNAYDNSQFYRTNTAETNTITETNRIWLNLVNSNNTAATTLIGYISDATYAKDRMFDAGYKVINEISIYSLIDNNPMIIQGRPAPFDDNDIVLLGITIPTNGEYKIAIDQVDGLFENSNQDIFIEDTYSQVIYNIRQSPYTFTAIAGNYNDRFRLLYKNVLLGTNPNVDNTTFGFITNNSIKIQSTVALKQIEIFDIAGKLITTYNVNGSSNRYEDNFPYANGVYIAKITLDNGQTVKKKLIH